MKQNKGGRRRRSIDRQRRRDGRAGRNDRPGTERVRSGGTAPAAPRIGRYDAEYDVSLGYEQDRAIIIV